MPQSRLAYALGVSTNSVIEWEAARISLRLPHFIKWGFALGYRAMVCDPGGRPVDHPVVKQPGEDRDLYEARRMVSILRSLRTDQRLTQEQLGKMSAISMTSVRHWEGLVTPPQMLGLIQCFQALGYQIELCPRRRL